METTDSTTIVIPMELTHDHAWELAQLVERIGCGGLQSLSVDET